jgi:hypothetical protein
LTEPQYWILYLGIVLFSFLTIFGIVNARRKNEPVYYWSSGVCFLLVIAVVAALLNQFLLLFAMMGLAVIISIVLLPQVTEFQREEILKQKQETNVSAPLRLKDFLTLKGWIKLRTTHGFRKTLTLYILINIGILVAFLLVFMVLGLMSPLMLASYTISTTLVLFIIGYQQVWKPLKEP